MYFLDSKIKIKINYRALQQNTNAPIRKNTSKLRIQSPDDHKNGKITERQINNHETRYLFSAQYSHCISKEEALGLLVL